MVVTITLNKSMGIFKSDTRSRRDVKDAGRTSVSIPAANAGEGAHCLLLCCLEEARSSWLSANQPQSQNEACDRTGYSKSTIHMKRPHRSSKVKEPLQL